MRTQLKNLKSNLLVVALICGAFFLAAGAGAAAKKLITGKDVKNSSITGADIKNGSISTSDLSKKIAVRGATGPAGAAAPPGSGVKVGSNSAGGFIGGQTAATSIPGLAFNFVVPEGATQLEITFTATCSTSLNGATNLDVLVNGTKLPPTGQQLCSTAGSGAATVVTRIAAVTPGTHAVDAKVRTTNTGQFTVSTPQLVAKAY